MTPLILVSNTISSEQQLQYVAQASAYNASKLLHSHSVKVKPHEFIKCPTNVHSCMSIWYECNDKLAILAEEAYIKNQSYFYIKLVGVSTEEITNFKKALVSTNDFELTLTTSKFTSDNIIPITEQEYESAWDTCVSYEITKYQFDELLNEISHPDVYVVSHDMQEIINYLHDNNFKDSEDYYIFFENSHPVCVLINNLSDAQFDFHQFA